MTRRFTHPPESAWLRFASEEAIREGLRLADILGARKGRRVAYARWRAWQRLRDEYPRCSVLGIAKVSGFNHTGVRYGLIRLAGGAPKARAPRLKKVAQFLPRPLQSSPHVLVPEILPASPL